MSRPGNFKITAAAALLALASGCGADQSANKRAGAGPGASADAMATKKFASTEFLCVPGAALADAAPPPAGEAPVEGLGLDAAAPVTYSGQVSALLSSQCTSCHKPGATLPDLTTYDGAKAAGARTLVQVQGGLMPTSGALAADQKALFQAWADGGYLQAPAAPSPAPAPAPAPVTPAGTGNPACGVPPPPTTGNSQTGTGGGTSTGTAHLVNYNDDVKALLAKACVTCHGAGAQAPDLSAYAAAKAAGAPSAADISAGKMPPSGALSAADKALFSAWATGGFAEKSP